MQLALAPNSSMVGGGGVRSDLANFIIDLEDEDCPESAVHVAAYQGQVEELEALLRDERVRESCLNARIRPFGATPLRLAATGVSYTDTTTCALPSRPPHKHQLIRVRVQEADRMRRSSLRIFRYE